MNQAGTVDGISVFRALAGGACVPPAWVDFTTEREHAMNPTERFYVQVAAVLIATGWLVVVLVQSAGGGS